MKTLDSPETNDYSLSMILETAILCLALNIYHEARGELIPAQYAVAGVTLNRADNDKRQVCKVVLAKHQFSWTTAMVEKREGRFVLKPNGYPKDEQAWELAKKIAAHAMKNPQVDFALGATHYHAKSVSPAWRRSLERVRQMGSHVFYRNA